jgi:hypothetical protein
MSLRVTYVPPHRLIDVWEAVEPILRRAIETSGGRYEMRDMLKKLDQGEVQLWVVVEDEQTVVAALTAHITIYPQCRALTGTYIAGDDMRLWGLPLLDALEDGARKLGCDRIEFAGRPGWRRWIEPLGFKQTWVTYEKRVVDHVSH